MNIEQLMNQSLQLLGLGMGSVFVILTLLIGIISVVSKLLPEEKAVQNTISAPVMASAPTPVATQHEHIAAIQAAIHQFRKKHK